MKPLMRKKRVENLISALFINDKTHKNACRNRLRIVRGSFT